MNGRFGAALVALLWLAATAAHATELRNIAYGSDPAQTMDVYLPEFAANSREPATKTNAPVILMVHGGAWRFGDKDNRRVTQNKIAYWLPRGFIFISVNYRMLPARDALQQRDDIVAALAFAQRHAQEWRGDPAQFILMGHSAGAHLVALIGADPDIALQAGAQRWLGTVILDSGALDVPAIMQRKHYRFYDPAFGGDPMRWRAASPLHQLHKNLPPMLAVCSLQRSDNSCGQAKAFADAANALGNRVSVLPQNLSHSEINQNLGLAGNYTDAVQQFIDSLLRAK